VTALTTQRLTRPEAMRLCQQKYGIWTGEQVRVYLAEHGVDVCLATVRKWADPDAMERYLAYNRSYKRQKRVMDRMRELQMAGITHGDIATLLSLDFGLPATSEQVRYMLACGRLSKPIREALS
jgi:hypothetical protein